MFSRSSGKGGIFISTRYNEHPSISSIRQEFGGEGHCLVLHLLCKICREGGEVQYGKDFCEAIENDRTIFKEGIVEKVVKRMVKEGLVDQSAFEKYAILTPPERYLVDNIEDVINSNIDITAPYYMVNRRRNK